jgi:hypothetical protein
MGSHQTSYPLQNLTDIHFAQTYSIWSGILGGFLLLVTIGVFEGAGVFFGLLFLLWSVICIFNVIQPRIMIANNRGAGIKGLVAIWDRSISGYSTKVHMDPAFAPTAPAAPFSERHIGGLGEPA